MLVSIYLVATFDYFWHILAVCVSRISRDSITGYEMSSKVGLVLIGARFLKI